MAMSSYKAPGVYITESLGSSVVNITSGDVITAIVGSARGFVRTSQQLGFNGAESINLANAPIADSISISDIYGTAYGPADFSVTDNVLSRTITKRGIMLEDNNLVTYAYDENGQVMERASAQSIMNLNAGESAELRLWGRTIASTGNFIIGDVIAEFNRPNPNVWVGLADNGGFDSITNDDIGGLGPSDFSTSTANDPLDAAEMILGALNVDVNTVEDFAAWRVLDGNNNPIFITDPDTLPSFIDDPADYDDYAGYYIDVPNSPTTVTLIADESRGTVVYAPQDPSDPQQLLGAVVSFDFCSAQPVTMLHDPSLIFADHIEPDLLYAGVTVSAGNRVFEENVDYIVRNNTIALTQSSSIANGQVVRLGYRNSVISPQSTVIITYSHTPENYYDPKLVTDFDTVRQFYGDPFNVDGIASELSLGCQLAFAAGAVGIWCVPTASSDPAQIIDGIEKLTKIENVDIVVPLSANTFVHSAAIAHVNLMCSPSMMQRRRTFIGEDGSAGAIDTTVMINRVTGMNNEHVRFVSPSSGVLFNSARSAEQLMPGYFYNCTLAGQKAAIGRPRSQTKMTIPSWGSLPQAEKRSRLQEQNEMAAGLTYIGDLGGQLEIRHDRTTSNESIEKQENTISMNHDYIIRVLFENAGQGIVGQLIDAVLLTQAEIRIGTLMSQLQQDRYLTDYDILSVRQAAEDPTAISVRIAYTPTYTANRLYIDIIVNANG